MAISLVGANLAWQQLRQFVDTQGNVSSSSNAAHVALLLKALKTYLTTQGKNPQLQVIPINGNTNASDGGNTASQVLADAACIVYAIVLFKSGSTAAVFKGTDHASTATTDGTQLFAIKKTNAGWVVEIFPDGISLANGLTVTEDTTNTGSTLTLNANRFDGFAIIGAPNTAV